MEPVKVSEARKKVTIPIPSIDGGLVTMYRSLTVQDQIDMQTAATGGVAEESLQKNFEILQKCFVEWNLVDDAGVVVPFTLEIARKTITQIDFFSLLQAVTGVQVVSDDGTRLLSSDEVRKKVLSA